VAEQKIAGIELQNTIEGIVMRKFAPFLIIFLVGLPASANDPEKVTSEYFRSEGGGTAVETKDGVRLAYFGLVLSPVRTLPENATLVAEFDNPTNPSKPLQTIYTPKPGEKNIVLRSETFACLITHRYYTVTVTLFADAERKHAISSHVQSLNVDIPSSAVRQLGLKEC
jgi:hypothetical protein